MCVPKILGLIHLLPQDIYNKHTPVQSYFFFLRIVFLLPKTNTSFNFFFEGALFGFSVASPVLCEATFLTNLLNMPRSF